LGYRIAFRLLTGIDARFSFAIKTKRMNRISEKRVAVIGLGSMGKKLVQLLVENNYEVLVWNRTISKAADLAGVRVCQTAEEAIRNASTIVMCIYDYTAVQTILYSIEDQAVLKGKTIINFTTGSPEEAAEIESFLSAHHAAYLNGALQVAPDQMGLKETTILMSGKNVAYDSEIDLLKVFGGNLKYLGEKAALASAVDLATLSWLYGSYIGLMYAVKLCMVSGVNLKIFSTILSDISPGFTMFFQHQIGIIEKNDFTISQSPLAISVSAVQRIKDAYEQQQLNTGFWESISKLFAAAESIKLGDKELASIIQVIGEKK
jgi:3-hydroxyisobutyrate dehydrogenase-like beta-hydroxyacid dehydrogenase